MPTFQLILEPTRETERRRKLEVDATMLIGDCVARLVDELGYSATESYATPISYHLRVLPQRQPLPNARRFSEVGIASETHVVLEAEAASYATQPIAAATLRSAQRVHSWRGGRRSFLITASVVTFCAVTGLGTGAVVALAQRRRNTRPQLAPASSPFVRGTLAPRVAVARLTFTGHKRTVRALGWSPNGQLLATGADDAQLLVWRADGTVQQQLAHPAPVTALAWSPESERIITGAVNQVTFLSVRTGTILASRAQPHTATVTALAWTGHNQLQAASGALDHRAITWRTTDYTPQTIFTRHTTPIEGVCWAADGQVIASCSHGGVVRVWDAENGQETHALFQNGQEPLRALAFTPTGAALAVGSDDGVTRLWEDGLQCQVMGTDNGIPVCRDAPVRLRVASSPIRAVAWSPDGRYLASGNNGGVCTLWSVLQTPQPLFSFTVAPGQAIHGLSWSPAGDQLATAAGNGVTIWSLRP